MQELVIISVSGLQLGALYAMMALGYYLVVSATGIVNFAQGEWAMASAVVIGALLAGQNLPYWFAVVVGVSTAVALAIGSDLIILRPMYRRGTSAESLVVAMLGVLIVVRYGAGILFGRGDVPVASPMAGIGLPLTGGFVLPGEVLLMISGMLLSFALVWVFLYKTWTGRSFRVVSINPLGAEICGINLQWIRVLSFGGGGLVAGFAGWLYAPLYSANYLMGGVLGLKGFVCLVIGGMRNFYGPLVGGIFIGMLEVLAAFYLGSFYGEGLTLIILLTFLLLRPNGIVGL